MALRGKFYRLRKTGSRDGCGPGERESCVMEGPNKYCREQARSHHCL